MKMLLARIMAGFTMSFIVVTSVILLFQNCSPVRFAGVTSSASVTSSACDPSVTAPQPYTASDGSRGTCTCSSAGLNVCTVTACANPSATLVGDVCSTNSNLNVSINGQSSASLVPSLTTPNTIVITATGSIQNLIPSDSTLTKVSGTCAQTTLAPSNLGLIGESTFNLGSQNFIYTPILAQNIAGCTWQINAQADSGATATATFTALLCSAGSLNSTTPVCTTSDGKIGQSICAQDGLSYNCVPTNTQNCTFNGQVVANGGSVTGYQTATVPYGSSCVSQVRNCANGVLSGTYANSSCASTPGASCTFNGQVVANGAQVTGYAQSQVGFGQTCQAGSNVCQNGNLVGAYQNASCSVGNNPDCNVNGQTLSNGSTQIVYAQPLVPFGQSCASEALTCANGVVSGANGGTYYSFASCSVGAPVACNFDGQTVANGTQVTAYQDTVVPYGSTCASQSRTCTNGLLSGSYQYPACQVGPAASCIYNGQTVASGSTVTGYSASSVAFGQICQPTTVTCNNGSLLGSLVPNCNVQSDPNCYLGGQTIADGASLITYASAEVPYGQTCASQTRLCSSGNLSGSYTALSCQPATASNCIFNGQTVGNGASVTAYPTSSISYGQTCPSEQRVCSNGTLSGSAQYSGCSVSPPATCAFAGQTIANGASVTAYSTQTVPYDSTCPSETATCNNGVLALDGGFIYNSCAPASECGAAPPMTAACNASNKGMTRSQNVNPNSDCCTVWGLYQYNYYCDGTQWQSYRGQRMLSVVACEN